MHLVAILRTDLTEDDKAMRLQRLLGVTAYEARQHAQLAPPRVVASRPTSNEATDLAGQLGAEGMLSISFTPDDGFSDAKRFIARSVHVTDHGIDALERHGAKAAIAWADVTAIFVGSKNKIAYCDIVDGDGKVLRVREGDTVFEGTGSRAGTIALGQTARAKSNGRFDDRLMKPAAIAAVLGPFASSPWADDLAEWLLWRSFRATL